MSTKNEVPENIAAIIEAKRQALLEERRIKAEKEEREQEEAKTIGKEKYDEYIQASLLKVPEYLRQYYVPGSEEPDLYRIGKGWEKPSDWLYFEVPGLAKILFAPSAKNEPWKYQTASPYEQKCDFDGYPIHVEPSLNFSDRQYGWTDDLDYALGCAQKQLQDYQKYLGEWKAKQEEFAQEAKEREALQSAREAADAQSFARHEQEQAKEKAEEQTLFDAIKNDPVALNMLKAFVLIYEERGGFREQLENADWQLYSMEERHSRHAAELRRQADEIERRAENEKYRLQSDLEDAEKKLKKSERGW